MSDLSDLADFLAQKWPDIKNPLEYSQRLVETYNGLDAKTILTEARRACLWEESTSHKKKNHARYFTNWLLRSAASIELRRNLGYASKSDEALVKEANLRSQKELDRTRAYLAKLESEPKHMELGVSKCREILKKLN